jgi:hypothetical protein
MAYGQRDSRLRSDQAALAGAVAIQAALGAEFLLGGLNKVALAGYVDRFREFVSVSPGAQHGVVSTIVHAAVLPEFAIMAQLARATELIAGLVLLIGAAELARQLISGRRAGHEPLVALAGAAAGVTLAGLSMTIYVLLGGAIPGINPALAFAPPIAIELFNVPVGLAIALLQLSRFYALRNARRTTEPVVAERRLVEEAA